MSVISDAAPRCDWWKSRIRFSLREFLLLAALIGVVCSLWFPANAEIPRRTGRDFDLAIFGNGYLTIVDQDIGQSFYTWEGRLGLDANGLLTVGSEWIVDPSITLPSDWSNFHVTHEGTCLVEQPGSSTETVIGCIHLTSFINPDGLQEVLPGIYRETEHSGPPTIGTPGDYGLGLLQQGWLAPRTRTAALGWQALLIAAPLGLLVWILIELRALRRNLETLKRGLRSSWMDKVREQ